MQKMKYAIVLVAAFCGVLATPVKKDGAAEEFLAGNKLFTAAIYKEITSEAPGNLIVSPFSVETVLSLTYEGAKGATASELITRLSLPSSEEKIEEAFKSFLPKMKGDEEAELVFTTANKVYVDKHVELEETFASVAESVFESEVGTVDFTQGYDAADEINAWVESKTNNKIQGLVNPDSLTAETSVLLVNTIYLSGKWQKMFVDFPTEKASFYKTETETAEAEFMHEEEYLNYYENEELDAKFLQLALQGGNVQVVVALPNEVDGISSLEQSIDKVLEPQPYALAGVKVDLPKFSIQSDIQFVKVLQKLGVVNLFSTNADLSGISCTNKDLYISQVIQKAFINVTESGIEAAAATDVVGPTAVVDTTVDFKADHPFLYYIINDGVVVFAGRYVDPSA